MTDKIDAVARSKNMSRIRSQDTAPEIKVRKRLHELGYRFRLHRRDLAGRPDIVLPKYRIAMFVNGCFWHRHRACREASRPKTNSEYWELKLTRNVERDIRNHGMLEQLGWKVVVLWECEIDQAPDLKELILARLAGDRLKSGGLC